MRLSIIFQPVFSKYFLGVMIVIYGGASASLLLTSISTLLKLCLFVVMVFCCFYRRRSGIAEFSQHTKQAWQVVLHNRVTAICVLQENSLVTHHLMILNFICEKTHKKYSICLFPDSLSLSDLRQLRSFILS